MKNKGLGNKERKIEKEEKEMKGESFVKADKKETTKNRAMRKV